MNNQSLDIVFTINNGYTKQLAVTLYSLLLNKQAKTIYNLYVMHYGLSDENQRYLQGVVAKEDERCSIEFLAISDADYQSIPNFSEIPRGGHWGKETNFRILLPKYLPHHDRILYLDTDIIVLRDLSHLSTLDMQKQAMAGVMDSAYVTSSWLSAPLHVLRLAEFEGEDLSAIFALLLQYAYVNAGVLLISLEAWRQHNFMPEALALMQRIYRQEKPLNFSIDDTLPGFKLTVDCQLFPDQDILNYLAIKKQALGYLPSNHNLASTFFALSGEQNQVLSPPNISMLQWATRLKGDALANAHNWQLDNPYIVHFVGKKPWQEFASGVNELYAQYAQQVGWHIVYAKQPFKHKIKKVIKGLLPYALVKLYQK